MRKLYFHSSIYIFRLFLCGYLISATCMVAAQEVVRFAFLTDLHVSPSTPNETYLNQIVEEVNASEVDFVMVSGDITNSGSNAELLAVKKSLDRLTKPVHIIPGNHETNWSESAGLKFNELWGNDRFLVQYKGFSFVGFNTGPYMKMGDGHIKNEDLQWLDRELSKTAKTGGILISMSHYPLAEGLDNWDKATRLLKKYNCKLAFCGHGHRLALFNFDGIPGIMGRSVIMHDPEAPGYNVVELRNDSVFVWPKVVGSGLYKPGIQFSYTNPDEIKSLPISTPPDYSVNTAYPKVSKTFEWSDTSSIFCGPCIHGSTVIYANSSGWIKAIDTKNKKKIWETRIQGPVYSTPVYADGIVVLGTVDGYILGLNSKNGREVWRINAGKPVLAEGIVNDGALYMGCGDTAFFKIEGKTGKVVWKFTGLKGLIQGKPLLTDNGVVFGAWDRHLYCLNKDNGELVWKWDNGKPQKLYSPGNIVPVCSEGKVFIVAPDRFMTAVDLVTGEQKWRTNRFQVRESMGISPDGKIVFAKLMNDTIVAVSATSASFEPLWAVHAGFGYEHNPCPLATTGHEVIAGTRNGMVIAVDGVTKKVKWKFKAGNSSINKLVMDTHKIVWFTTMEGSLIGLQENINY